MADKHAEQQGPRYSRRKFVAWTGQLAAGISLAGVGLGLAGSSPALAKGVHPDCIGCPPYGTVYKTTCINDKNCVGDGNNVWTSTRYIYTGGCVPPGHACPISTNCFQSCKSGCVC